MRSQLSIAEARAMLEAHPRRIAAAVASVPATRLRADRMLDEWTATDVLAHLRSCSDVFGDVVPRILAADRPRLDVVGPRDRSETAGYRAQSFAVSLRAFVRQRQRSLALLRALPPSAGARAARIVERGRSRERTVRDYTDWLARHEQGHVEQFERFARKLARE